MRKSLLSMALLLAAALPDSACSTDEKKAGLILAVQTDMSIPKDVDSVEIEISVYGKVAFRQLYQVGDGGLHIPATLTVLPPSESGSPVTIRVISYQDGAARTLRRVVTTVPEDREALLRMPIQWLCEGQLTTEGEEVSTTCADDQSCLTGSCVPDEVDSAELPDFTASLVFGGAADTKGSCFDTVPCFSYALPVSGLDKDTCTLPIPSGSEEKNLNFAFLTPAGSDGICPEASDGSASSPSCYVPLDHDPVLGWSLDENGAVKLPEGACARLDAMTSLGIVSTNVCPAKSADIPTCGPWSSVSGNSITVALNDIPLPDGMGGEPGTGGVPSSGGVDGSGGAPTALVIYPVDVGSQLGWGYAPAYAISGGFWPDKAAPEAVSAIASYTPSSICISGTTHAPSLGNWLNFNLNEAATVASTYDAAAHGVVGFEFTVTGDFPTNMVFKAMLEGTPAEFCKMFSPADGKTRVLFEEMTDCENLSNTMPLDPAKLLSVRWVIGGQETVSYDGCIEGIAVVARGTTGSGGAPTGGAAGSGGKGGGASGGAPSGGVGGVAF